MATFNVEVEGYDVQSLGDCTGGPEWELVPERAAVLVHDMQPYYLNVLDSSVRARVGAAASELVSRARFAGVPIFASGPRPASAIEQRGLLGPMWGSGPSAEEVAIIEPDFVTIAKRSYSAFYASDLDVELRRRGRDQLIVVGVFASAGILATTFDAFARDIQCFVGIESTADYTAHQHRTALNLIASLTGVVTSSANLLHDRHRGPLD
ncbi:Isochorismatase [Rhodococcus sp. AW25M09]|uniref:isochorismatase family protein n=1 Tax=Rhodococcus sp. AW25M09 TaxID=1268303 RepID=UPI0002AC8ACF|nr:isochorismatase family protein [Rhodococcus sp. AW25M09]CCQ17681.1 Isochorismatase [Rhodococcus sp. AW25M09]